MSNTPVAHKSIIHDSSEDETKYLKELGIACQNLVDSIYERHGGELPKLIFKGKPLEEWTLTQTGAVNSNAESK